MRRRNKPEPKTQYRKGFGGFVKGSKHPSKTKVDAEKKATLLIFEDSPWKVA